jgi:hypothetical protein
VYRGTKGIMKFMPSKQSFINANTMTPKELATKLLVLEDKEEEYNKFLEYRKRKSLSNAFRSVALRSYTHPNVICRLGAHLHMKRKWEALPIGKTFNLTASL